jgi:osmotically-inducible protein OsmY
MVKNTMTDLQLRAQKAILDDPRTKEHGIEVRDDNGVITLNGYVPSREVKETAEAVVNKVFGVVSVINRLHIQAEVPEETLKEEAKNV